MLTRERDAFRLPQNVRPIKYKITLEHDFETPAFTGVMSVAVVVESPTAHIVMNAAGLKVTNAVVLCGGQAHRVSSIVSDEEKQTLTIKLDKSLMPGAATLSMKFEGALNDNLCGFYRAKYTLPDGTERYMATTQFEAIDARRAFPCFDEPASKAIFELALVTPSDRVALSNMPQDEEIPAAEFKVTCFEPPPIMSTYLVAFIVGDLEHIEGYTKNGTSVRVWATPGKKDQCSFALDVGIKALEYFEDYFEIPYPLPKLDMAAIPDFEAGAMENWGLVTFREAALLFDQERSSTETKQRVAYTIAHELAHQWFGDLVTMQWWNDLWLNESFATLMGFKAVAHIFPEWNIWERFYTGNTAAGLSLDGLATSHPIEADIKDPKEIGQIFDDISYSKGASVLRMLENYLGEETFQKGVKRYLTAHQYGNAQTEDLWTALSKEAGEDIASMMDTWTKQSGYPVVEAKKLKHRDTVGVRLSQKQFLYHAKPDANDRPKLWTIPINVIKAKGRKYTGVLDRPIKNFELDQTQTDVKWIKINASQAGFFRVKYSPEMQEALSQAMKQGELPTLDRIGLASDAYALQRAGMIPATQYLDLALSYRNETEYSVWSEISAGLSDIMSLLAGEPYYGKLKQLVEYIFRPIGQNVGWDPGLDEDELAPMLRSLALAQMANCGDKDTIEEARQRFAMLCQKSDSISPNLRSVVCNISARYGSTATYESLLRIYREAIIKEEQITYLRAMGFFRNKKLLSKTLGFALSDEVRLENTTYAIISVADSSLGRNLAWEFVQDNWDELRDKLRHSMFSFGRIIESVVSRFGTVEEKQTVEQFFAEHPVPEASMALAQSLERVDMNIAWLARNRDEIGQWLLKNKK